MVQQIGHDDEQGGPPELEAPVRDRSGDMRLAAPGRASHYEPTMRVVSEGSRIVDAALKARLIPWVGAATTTDQVVKCEAGERAQVAVALEPRQPVLSTLELDATAGKGLPELRVPQRHVATHKSGSPAVGTRVLVFCNSGRGRRVRITVCGARRHSCRSH